MRCAIIGNADNTTGLQLDVQLLTEFLVAENHEVTIVDWNNPGVEPPIPYDIGFFLERVAVPSLLHRAKHSIGIFNIEWFPLAQVTYLPAFSQIWAKSRDSERAYQRFNPNTIYTSFLAKDRFNLERVTRLRQVLHVQGQSQQKGTEMILAAWSQARRQAITLPPLVIVSHTDYTRLASRHPNVQFIKGPIRDAALSQLMNDSMIHLCPSEMEGFGHYIAEAVSVGAITITTNRSPMNEHVQSDYGVLIEPEDEFQHGLTLRYVLAPDAILKAVQDAAAWTSDYDRTQEAKDLARDKFIVRNAQFRTTARRLLAMLS